MSAVAVAPNDTAVQGLRLSDVSMRYPDGTEVLDGVDLEVTPGQMVSIVGASGCGKSTVLKLASGLLRPTAGTVSVRGELGYVFQDPTLMPWRTLIGNVGYLAGWGRLAPHACSRVFFFLFRRSHECRRCVCRSGGRLSGGAAVYLSLRVRREALQELKVLCHLLFYVQHDHPTYLYVEGKIVRCTKKQKAGTK